MLKEVFISLTLAMPTASFAYADGFAPLPFDIMGATDNHSKLELITGGSLGADVLEHWESAVLVFIGKRTVASNEVHPYSFNFDGRPAIKFAQLTKDDLGDLYEALSEPNNYGSAEHEFPIYGTDPEENRAQRTKYDEAWAQDLALEVVRDKRFVRVYLDKEFTRCYFVTCAGERSHDLIVSAELTKVLRRIAKSKLKWTDIPNGLVNKQADQAGVDQGAAKPSAKAPVKDKSSN